MTLQSHDSADNTQPWDPPLGFFDAYRAFQEASCAAMRSAMKIAGDVDEDFLAPLKPEADEDILKHMRTLPPEDRDHIVELRMMGYEAAKKHPRVQSFTRELMDTLLQHHDRLTAPRSYQFDE